MNSNHITQDLYRVCLIDDMPIYRLGLKTLLENCGRYQIVEEIDTEMAAQTSLYQQVDIVLLTLDSSKFDAMAILKKIKERNSAIKVLLVMNDIENSALVLKAIRMDANGYLLRLADKEEWLYQLDRMMAGGMAVSAKVTTMLAQQLRETPSKEEPHPTLMLTRRERETLNCIASSYSNRDVALHLGISEGTVKVHVKHLLKKLNFRSRVEAAVWAAGEGFGVK